MQLWLTYSRNLVIVCAKIIRFVLTGKGIEATSGMTHVDCSTTELSYKEHAAKGTRPSDAECTTSSKKRFTRKSIEQPSCPLIETCFLIL